MSRVGNSKFSFVSVISVGAAIFMLAARAGLLVAGHSVRSLVAIHYAVHD